jgi:hypothetical protein
MYLFFTLLFGICIGLAAGVIIFKRKISGTIRIDQSDSVPYLFLELSDDVEKTIMKKRYATFKVDVRNYISHK